MDLITTKTTPIPGRGFDYDIKTAFHQSFPAITVRYRTDGAAYGEPKGISIVYGSGGIETPESDVEEACFAEQMAGAWKTAESIIRHHLASADAYTQPGTAAKR